MKKYTKYDVGGLLTGDPLTPAEQKIADEYTKKGFIVTKINGKLDFKKDPNFKPVAQPQTTTQSTTVRKQNEGTIPLPDYNNPDSRMEYASAFRNKYGKDTLKGYGDIPLRVNEKPVYGSDTSKNLITKAAQAVDLDPALLYASSMIEGQSGLYPGAVKGRGENQIGFTGDKNFPVSGLWNFGLDSFKDYYPSLKKKGYLPEDFDKNFKIWEEEGSPAGAQYRQEGPMFSSTDTGIQAKAAMMRAYYDELDSYAKKKGVNLNPEQRDFFALAHFNSGSHGYEMLDAYNQAGLLKNNNFIENMPDIEIPAFNKFYKGDSSKARKLHQQIYTHVAPRMAAARGLKEEGLFGYGGKIPKKPKKYPEGGEIDPITGQPKDAGLTNKLGVNIWENAVNSPAPVNPDQPQIFPIDQTQGTPVNQGRILPLNEVPDLEGMMGRKQEIETISATSMAAINAFFNSKNTAQQNRTNNREAIMREISAQRLNPYLEGTGSQAIMKYGGEIPSPPIPKTKLNSKQEQEYNIWRNNLPKNLQYEGDYNLRQMWLENPNQKLSANMHFPDKYKMPNHPTFSNESMYFNPTNQYMAGKWQETDSSWNYNPYNSKFKQPIIEKKFKKGGEIMGDNLGIQTLNGGKSKVISTSDHSNPMVEFEGKTHDEGGIGLQYGGNIAEVEDKEVGWIDNEGSLNIFGKLKLPGSNKTFKKVAEDMAKRENKVDGMKSKYLNILNHSNQADPYQQSAQSTAKVMIKSLDKQSKQIAEEKEALSSYQNLILSMTNSGQNMAYGGKLPKKPKKYPDGGILPYNDKAGLHLDPNMLKMAMMADPTNFNTGDFEFMSSIQQVPIQTARNFNTGDFEFRGGIQQIPLNGDKDFDFNSSINRKIGFNTGDFEFQGGITENRKMAEGGTIDGDPIDPKNPHTIQKIIDKYSGGKSPLPAETFIQVAEKYGVPLDLMIAQAIQESKFGTEGRAVRTKNIFNVGNTDDGTESKQGSWRKGLEKYAQLIRDEYAGEDGKVSTQDILNRDFTRLKGGRYATDPNYTKRITQIINDINPGNTYSYTTSNAAMGDPREEEFNNTRKLYERMYNSPTTPEDAKANFKKLLDTTYKDFKSYSSVYGNSTSNTAVNTSFNFTPVYQPISGGQTDAVQTNYGPARREANPVSDNVTIVPGGQKRDYISPLAVGQIAPELLSIATNRRQSVPQFSYQPDLKQTFDISYQLGRNENQATFNQVAKLAEQTGNVDALSQLAAQKYRADESYNMQEIQGNATQKLQTYNQNIDTLNDARVKNLALIADQQVKQAQADFNTRKETMAAFSSIAAKTQQNALENKTYNAYANLFKHYGFDKKGNVTFIPDNVAQKFTPGEAQAFGFTAAQQGAQAIMNGNFSRQFTKVKNQDGSTTTTETLGTNKKIQEEYKALQKQGFDDNIIGNILRAKYPETITQD